ncbi:LETM1-like protein-domain-containing protein [Blastocladiella britannica]|nr:LETM1-like protein-domain-containing protein [Blastocladiella britannica]
MWSLATATHAMHRQVPVARAARLVSASAPHARVFAAAPSRSLFLAAGARPTTIVVSTRDTAAPFVVVRHSGLMQSSPRWLSSTPSHLDEKKPADPPATTPTSNVPAPAPKKPLMQKLREETWPHVKEELVHYREGSKLLWFEARVSMRYLRKVMVGEKLTRRELRQLKRTVADLVRLVPFVALVLIPFAELALPVLLKLFPNMLPSTFEKSFDQEEKRKKMLKMRLELAKFLQETVDEMAVGTSGGTATAAKDFTEFFRKIRTTGEPAETSELIRVAQRFENEVTLENLSRPQLVSMCKYMGINAFGTDNFLRFQIRTRMRQLHTDDQMIFFEGVDSLSTHELQRACADRGIKTIGVSPARLRHDLQQWLELHLLHKIPSVLLILSRAFIISDQPMHSTKPAAVVEPSTVSSASGEPNVAAAAAAAAPPPVELPSTTAEALQATLQSLPTNLITEAELKLSDQEGKASFKKKLEALKQQEEIIADELEQERAAAEAALAKKKEEEAVAAAASAAVLAAAESATPAPASSGATESSTASAPTPSADSAPSATTAPATESAAAPAPATTASDTSSSTAAAASTPAAAAAAEAEVEMTTEQVKELSEAIKMMVGQSAVETERNELEAIKLEREEKAKREKAAAQAAAAATAPVEAKAPEQAPTANPDAATPAASETFATPAPTTPAAAPAQVETPAAPSTEAPATPAPAPVAAPPVTAAVAAEEAAAAAAAAATSKATTRLESQVDRLLSKIQVELEQYDTAVAPKLPHILPNERGQISVADLETALSVIRSRPANDDMIKAIVKKLDRDGDGFVALNELMDLARAAEEIEGVGVVVDKAAVAAAAAAKEAAKSAAAAPAATSTDASGSSSSSSSS